MRCMPKEENGNKGQGKGGRGHLTPSIVHLPLCMCICLCNFISISIVIHAIILELKI
jgi:hypothetical protein